MITRHSSRRSRLDRFLSPMLHGATGYDRIAGYFRSSILEVAGDGLEQMAPGATARIICNSDLHPLDVLTARAAQQAMYREWRRDLPEDLAPALRDRLARLYELLVTGKMQVRVLPDERFGFAHGKAGIIRRANGAPIAFLGSTNESQTAWTLNYELLWCDESAEGVAWVQDEFDALWHDPNAHSLAEAVVVDAGGLAQRTFIPSVAAWKGTSQPEAAAVAVELPIYRKENGLWAHQKYFVHRAFTLHQQGGARLVLADQVGLGKTVQLALAAKLMALWGGGRVLVVAPKTLLVQWQEEMWSLLALPSARWTGRSWVDEQNGVHPVVGPLDLRRCPRRVGLVSASLITNGGDVPGILCEMDYECIIIDEAHRARRRNMGATHRSERAEANNLLRFARDIAPKTRSMLLATATPVQLDPIEAYDLLDALNRTNETVLGSRYSQWNRDPRQGLAFVLGRDTPPTATEDAWEWIRDPFPLGDEGPDFEVLRRQLRLERQWAAPETFKQLDGPARQRVKNLAKTFFSEHNPYIRHIIRRTREYLETVIYTNLREGFRLLIDRMRDFVCLEQCYVLLEKTGHYHKAIVDYLLELDISVYLLHVQKRPRPMLKTDKRDALGLANHLYNQLEKGIQVADRTQLVRRALPPSDAAAQLKGLIGHRHEIVHECTRRKNKLVALYDQLFPELMQVFLNPNSPTALKVRQQFPTPQAFAAASLDTVCAVKGPKRPSRNDMARLQERARHSIGVKDSDRRDELVFEQEQLIQELYLLQKHLAQIDERMTRILGQSREGRILLSLPSMGEFSAAAILAAIGNINNFPNAASLKSYFGWAPRVIQSGTTVDRTKLTRAGERTMKEVMYLLTLRSVREHGPWSELYQRLVERKCEYRVQT